MELFFQSYKHTLDFFTAIGTLLAAGVAILVVLQNSSQIRKRRLSGLSVTSITHDGVLSIQNNTDIDLTISTFLHRDVIDERIAVPDFKWISSTIDWKHGRYECIHNNIVLSIGEVLDIHLKNIAKESSYISLVALKLEFSGNQSGIGRAKYYLFRYAGDLARNDDIIGPISHPHNKWVLERSVLES